MNVNDLIDMLRDNENYSNSIDDHENEIIGIIDDLSVFTKKGEHGGELPLQYLFRNGSIPFIKIVLAGTPKLPKDKELLKYAMHMDGGPDRPLEILKLAQEFGYRLDETIATLLLQALCLQSMELEYLEGNPELEIVDYLHENGADLDAADENGSGFTPLMYTFIGMSPVMTTKLIEKGANPNYLNKKNESALLICAGKAPGGGISYPEDEVRIEVTKILIDAGANINYKINDTHDALYFAKKTKRPMTIKLLESHSN